MADAFVDTDILIRLLTGDDPIKQESAAALFEQVESGALRLAAPDTVIADSVFVLSSPRLYHLPRPRVRELLAPLVRLPGFEIDNRRVVLAALDLFAGANIDFGDAMIVAAMRDAGVEALYSYDADFDRIPGIRRREPSAATGDGS